MSEPYAQYSYAQYPAPEPPRRHRHWLGLAATGVVALLVGASVTLAVQRGSSPTGSATATSKTALSTAQIADRVNPALVDVTSTLGYQNATAYGTGIVLTSNGEVLTNNHVINGATSVSVTDIGNGKTYHATVVGYDESHDIAVLQLSGASGLTAASTGDSSAVKVGDSVVGLGNAGGKGGTPSTAAGTVTALNQSITASDENSGTSEQLTGLIETNANIQAGDSGGPLVNQYGQVIGVNTAASTNYQFGGNGAGGSGLGGGFGGSGFGGSGAGGLGNGSDNSSTSSTTQGFTIPISTALSIARQIEAHDGSGPVHIGATAFLGVAIESSQDGSGSQFGGGTSGVTIQGVTSGSPAASAGLTPGDVVTSVAGHAVSSSKSIQQVLETYHPGDKVTLDWTDANGQSHSATVTLATGPAA